jgi:hypothetical protein
MRLVAALALLAVTAGCLGGGPVPTDELDAEPPFGDYEWDSGVDVHVELTSGGQFQAVYNLSARGDDAPNGSIDLFRNDGFGGQNPIPVSSVRYRYPNGTQLNGSELVDRGGSVSQSRDAVTVSLPNGTEGGQLAFVSSASPKRFTLPVFVEGSYEVVLPEDRDVTFPVVGSRSPPGSVVGTTDDGRVRVAWTGEDEVTSRNLVVQYYHQRDIPLFGGLLAVAFVVGGVGLYRYRRQIRSLREQREELGLDVDTDDDSDRGPPPGMR